MTGAVCTLLLVMLVGSCVYLYPGELSDGIIETILCMHVDKVLLGTYNSVWH